MRKLFTVLISLAFFYTCGEAPDLGDIIGGIEEITPQTTIDSHQATFDNSTVTMNWEGGNTSTTSFSYMLLPLSYSDIVDTYTSWSDWDTSTTVDLSYLDEGNYKFSVKGRVTTENEQEDPTETTFVVDAITGSALRMYPLKQTITSGSQFQIYLHADDIAAVAGFEVQMNLSNSNISYNGWEKGSIFTSAGGTSVEGEYTIGGVYSIFPPPNVTDDTIILSGVISGSGLGTGTSGETFEIIKLTFTYSGAASTSTDITLDTDNTFLRDADNENIQLFNRVLGTIEGGE